MIIVYRKQDLSYVFFFLSKCALISECLDICAGKQDQNIIKSKWSHDLSTFQHFSCFDQRMIKERDFYYFTFHLLHWIIQKNILNHILKF